MTESSTTTAVPRPITPRARRRSWAEMYVRPWVLLTVVFILAGLIMAGSRVSGVLSERRTITAGVPVNAKIVDFGASQARRAERDETISVTLEYTPPGASAPIRSSGILPRKPGEVLQIYQQIDVKIDPDNPKFFTDRTDLPPLTAALGVPLLLGGIGLACFAVAAWARRSALKTFTAGALRRATVVSIRQSPAAPMSKQIGFTLNDSDDKRVHQCFWPNHLGAITPGQAIDVLVPANPDRSVAAAAYGVGAE